MSKCGCAKHGGGTRRHRHRCPEVESRTCACLGLTDQCTGCLFPVYEQIEAEGVNLHVAPNSASPVIRDIVAGTTLQRLDNALYPDQNPVPNPVGLGSFFKVRVSGNPLVQGFATAQRFVAATGMTAYFIVQTPHALATQAILEKACTPTKGE